VTAWRSTKRFCAPIDATNAKQMVKPASQEEAVSVIHMRSILRALEI
jgi:hypothetical protein